MQLMKRALSILCVPAAVGMMVLVAGCEENNTDVQRAPDSGAEFRISPGFFNMSTNVPQLALTVVGGVDPFVWSISAPVLGSLSGTSEFSRVVNYKAAANQSGVNTIRVQDSRGWSAISVLAQGP